jgi:hypothetical protein
MKSQVKSSGLKVEGATPLNFEPGTFNFELDAARAAD